MISKDHARADLTLIGTVSVSLSLSLSPSLSLSLSLFLLGILYDHTRFLETFQLMTLARSTENPKSVPSVDSLPVCSARFRDRTLDGEERGINNNFLRSASAVTSRA